MLLIECLAYNLLFLALTALAGWFPARFLESRIGYINHGFRFFSALFLGYLLLQSFYACWVTQGLSMQLLNFLPFVMMAFLPAVSDKKPPAVFRFGSELWLSFLLIIALTIYFVRSYSIDFQNISHYPFIDLVSYAGSAYGMGQAGAEVSFYDAALYYPAGNRLNLYHYTELWYTELMWLISGKTELWLICFILPVQLILFIVTGIQSLSHTRKLPVYYLLVVTASFLFASGKLLLFQDYFLYQLLDLFGLKLALIIPMLLLLWQIRKNQPLLSTFLLLLPQINILLAVCTAIIVAVLFITGWKEKKRPVPAIWIGYLAYMIIFLLLLRGGSSGNTTPPGQEFSLFKTLQTFFTYSREAFFNLGFNYWMPFILVAGLFRSRLFLWILLPFLAGKAAGKGWQILFPEASEWAAATELLFFLLFSALLVYRFRRLVKPVYIALFMLVLVLCAVSAIGYAVTGFMDFEQIYTLFACSLFFVLCFQLFLEPAPEEHPALLTNNYQNQMICLCLVMLTASTFRLQKALPFDRSFYSHIQKDEKEITRSIYLSDKRFMPFPLHVKAGFPLLFTNRDAHSTPVCMAEDSSWRGQDEAWHVEQFPFPVYAGKRANASLSEDQKKLGFIHQFGIRYAWVDNDYALEKTTFLRPYVEKVWRSEKDRLELWKIRPDLIKVK